MKPVGTVNPQVCLNKDIKSRMNSNFLLLSFGQNLFVEINSGINELIIIDFYGFL